MARRYTVESQAVFTVGYRIPVLTVTIKTEAGVEVDITGLTLAFAMWPDNGTEASPTVNFGSMTLTAPSSGQATYAWSAADITAIGTTGGTFTCAVRIGTGSSSYELTHPFWIDWKPILEHPAQSRGG